MLKENVIANASLSQRGINQVEERRGLRPSGEAVVDHLEEGIDTRLTLLHQSRVSRARGLVEGDKRFWVDMQQTDDESGRTGKNRIGQKVLFALKQPEVG